MVSSSSARDQLSSVESYLGEVRAYGTPTSAELERINQRSLTKLSADQVFVFDVLPSNKALDSHFTHMDADTTLNRFAKAANAQRGVPVLYNHDGDQIVGRSLSGKLLTKALETPRGGTIDASPESPQFYSVAYIPRDDGSDAAAAKVVRKLETGILTDFSVRFGGPDYWYRCDECGENLLRSDECTHWPGMTVKSDNGKKTHRATATVMDGDLLEYSSVWRGSNPTATMVRAMEDRVARGILSHAEVLELDSACDLRMAAHIDWDKLRSTRTVIDMAQNENTERSDAALLDEAMNGPAPEARAEGPAEEPQPVAPAEDQTRTPGASDPLLAVLRAAGVETLEQVQRTLAEAADGRSYRETLIELCHKAGARCTGVAYEANREGREKVLRALGVDELKQEIEHLNAVARALFGKNPPTTQAETSRIAQEVGGRQTVPNHGPLSQTPGQAPAASGPVSSKAFNAPGGRRRKSD